jgi:hypothetical protein
MRSHLGGFAGVLSLMLAVPGLAQDGQPPLPAGETDGPPFRTSEDQLNQELDRSLESEYDEDHPAPVDPGPPPVVAPPPDRDRFELRLGGLAAHYYSQLKDVRVRYREGGSGGEDIRVDDDDAIADFGPEHTQLYRGWFDIGKHVSFEGGYWSAVYRDTQEITQGFTFGRQSFAVGERVGTKVELTTADLDLVIKPVNNRWVELGLHLGTRYMVWETTFEGPGNREVDSKLEAAVPVIGASIAFRPTRFMELFAKGRLGYLSYDRPRSSRYDDGDIDTIEAKEKNAKSVEVDVGVKFIFAETIGLVAGYRFDHLRLEREVDQRTEGVRGTAHGVYAGLILEF